MSLPIEEYFKYHPPTTEERKLKHERINSIALEFAKIVDCEIKDEATKQFAIFAIQQARMFANQGIFLRALVDTPWLRENLNLNIS